MAPPEISRLGSPFAYFSRLFTDEIVNCISEQTNIYFAQVNGYPIQTNPKEITVAREGFYKVRPLLEMLRQQCLGFPASCKQSVDEVMVHYKGTGAGNPRQYISNKPDKWGFKLFCRARSTGIIHHFLVYQEKSTFFNIPQSEEDKAMLIGERVVTTLCKTVQCPESTVVFCDNYLTSEKLIQTLAETTKIRCLGTVWANRTGGAGDRLKTDKELCKE